MAETPDNHMLSQEELDALIAAVNTGDAPVDDDPLPYEDVAETAAPGPAPRAAAPQPTAARLQMASFDNVQQPHRPMSGFDRVQDIPLELTVELGRTRLLIKDILELSVGSIVELEKIAGEPVELLANGLLIARGEVVVIEDNFGVRITEIITSAERKSLAEDNLSISAA